MSVSRTSTRFDLFAFLLGAVVLSLFGSVVAADRALVAADQRSVELDARSAAVLIDRELRGGAELLSAFAAATSPEMGGALRLFDAVWVLDRRGRVLWRRGTTTQPDSATIAQLALGPPGTAWPQAGAWRTTVLSESRALLIAVPLRARGEQQGVGVGKIQAKHILENLPSELTAQSSVTLHAGGTVLAVAGHLPRGSQLESSAPITSFGAELEVRVAHPQSGRALRGALWILGVLALAALWAGLVTERRQAINLAGRTEELERLYQEVAKANRMKSEFLANVSHELRTPLNAIVGFAEMLKDGTYGELTPRQELPVDRIATSTAHLSELVDRLLDIGKIAAGRVEVHAEEMALSPFVLDVVAEMEPLLSERGLTMSINTTAALPRIRTDPTHLRHILINLLGNAVKYTTVGGIQVRAKVISPGAGPAHPGEGPGRTPGLRGAGSGPEVSRAWVALQVSDTGVGIAEEDRERVFDEFEQVNAGARSDSARRGTGLGLAISRRLARLLGGDLTVASEPGRGSTFTVWLPLGNAAPSQV